MAYLGALRPSSLRIIGSRVGMLHAHVAKLQSPFRQYSDVFQSDGKNRRQKFHFSISDDGRERKISFSDRVDYGTGRYGNIDHADFDPVIAAFTLQKETQRVKPMYAINSLEFSGYIQDSVTGERVALSDGSDVLMSMGEGDGRSLILHRLEDDHFMFESKPFGKFITFIRWNSTLMRLCWLPECCPQESRTWEVYKNTSGYFIRLGVEKNLYITKAGNRLVIHDVWKDQDNEEKDHNFTKHVTPLNVMGDD